MRDTGARLHRQTYISVSLPLTAANATFVFKAEAVVPAWSLAPVLCCPAVHRPPSGRKFTSERCSFGKASLFNWGPAGIAYFMLRGRMRFSVR